MGTFQTTELIETFVNYTENIKKCVCLIYDPQRSKRGSLALRAIRLKDSFIELFKAEKTTAKDLIGAGLSHRDVFQDIPIRVGAPSPYPAPGQGSAPACATPFLVQLVPAVAPHTYTPNVRACSTAHAEAPLPSLCPPLHAHAPFY